MNQRPAWLPVVVLFCVLGAAGCRTTSSKALISTDDESEMERRARAHAQYAAAVIYDINDEPEDALDAFYQAATLDSENETLALDVSRRFIIARQPERALEILKASAARPDSSGEIWARLGLVYTQLGRSADAVQANSVAIKKSPKQLDAYKNFFNDLMLANKHDEALKVLGQAVAQKDVSPEFLIGVAEMYAQFLNQFPTRRKAVEPPAVAALDRAAALSPASDMLRLRLADAYLAMSRPMSAATYYEISLTNVMDVPFLRDTLRDKLAEIYLRAGSNQLAVAHLEAVVRDEPSNAKAHYLLGLVALDEQRWSDATDHFQRSIVFNPGFERAYYDLASAQIAAERPAQALATLNDARRRFPQNFLMEYLFASAFIESKAYAQAVGHLNAAEVIAGASDSAVLNERFYFQCGVAYERSGQHDQAARYFKKSIELSPDFAAALNYLGYMWADRGENLEEAERLIARALKIEPNNEAYLDSMGWVRFKQGDYKSALKYIQKAIEASEEPDAEIYDHLGDIYAAMNQPDKAREAWEKALSVEPNDDIRKKLEPPAAD
ncbi:MAG TPA: tetratricopeptide repeat protein [Verrucomicrobiota bacterium]|nr:tetratricopeptide repeat protein [Verrucomicrobiota bacterium]